MSREANDVKLDVSPTFRRAIELWCRMYLWQADPLLRITTWLVRKSTIIRKFDHCLTVLNNNLINRFSLYLSIRIYFHRLSLVPLWYILIFLRHFFDRYVPCTMISYKQTFSVCLLCYLSLSISIFLFYYYYLLLLLQLQQLLLLLLLICFYYTRLTMSAFCLTSKCLRTASFD